VAGGVVTAEELLERYAARERVFVGAELRGANLQGAHLGAANLQGADLEGANLDDAYLRGAYLGDADLEGAKLRGANLRGAYLGGANLQGANLRSACLQRTDLEHADLRHANLRGADIRVRHLRPLLVTADSRGANLDWRTVAQSLDIPDCDLIPFLARTGMPLVTATYLVESLRSIDATELFTMLQSVFISYGRHDHDVSEAIRTSLGENGVKTWWWPDNAPAGGRIHRVVRNGIKKYDRMVLLISDSSLRRQGVINEIVECLQREAREGASDVVIPVVLDGAIYGEWWTADVESGADGTRPPTEYEIEQRKDIHGVLMERVHVDLKGAEPGDAKWNDGMRRILAVLKKDPYDS
jgi:hypothetical protein